MNNGQPVSRCRLRAASILCASTFTSVIGASGQYNSGSRVVTSPMRPSCAKSSTGSLFQNERSEPVSFSFAIVCSSQLKEKKLVSPQKYAPPVTDSSGKLISSTAASASPFARTSAGAVGSTSAAAAADSGHPVCECGAVHHSSDLAVGCSTSIRCAGTVSSSAASCGSTGTGAFGSAETGSGSAAGKASLSPAEDLSRDVGIWFSTVLISKSEVNGLFKNPITFVFPSLSLCKSVPKPDM